MAPLAQHVPPQPKTVAPAGALARFGTWAELKFWRPDLNERAWYLSRAELVAVYGRAALRGWLRQARSLERLAPGLKQQRRLSRERSLQVHRRRAVEQKLRSLEIKARQLNGGGGLAAMCAELSAELESTDGAIKQIDAKMAALTTELHARPDEAAPALPRRDGRATEVELLRRAHLRDGADQRLVIEMLQRLEEASHSAAGSGLKQGYETVLREALEPLLLAAPRAGDVLAFCTDKLSLAIDVLKRILRHPAVKGMEPRARTQLLEELIRACIYPGYRGEVVIAYGGTEGSPTVRVPSYVLPGIAVLQEFAAAGLAVPRLRVLNAYAMAVRFNGIREDTGRAVAERTASLLDAFIRSFFPALAAQARFTIPSYGDFTDNAIFRDGVAHLMEFARRYPENKQLQSLLKKAARHSRHAGTAEADERVRIAAGYVASHVVECSFGDVRTQIAGGWQPDFVIKVGGDGETDFNFFQDVLANLGAFAPEQRPGSFRPNSAGWPKAGFQITPIQLNAAIGSTPPYYALAQGEVMIDRLGDFTFEEIVSYYRSDSRLKTVAIDLELLPVLGVPGEAFVAFLREHTAATQNFDRPTPESDP